MAQGARAYAPENLSELSQPDRTRVIRLEYSEQSGGRAIPQDQLRFYLDQVNRSNWTFSRIRSDIARSLAGGGDPPSPPIGPPGGGSGPQLVRCESTDGRYRTCRLGYRVGQVRLVRQLSRGECIRGRSFGTLATRSG